jgi:NTP pyrophosphatase (non-canonical NTP hydrolase)
MERKTYRSDRDDTAESLTGILEQVLDLLNEAEIELEDALSRRQDTAAKLEEVKRRISELKSGAA